ncbi:TPA: SEC10/PgrA surface exclusion domain-containing protein, partial [Streptococcus suis]
MKKTIKASSLVAGVILAGVASPALAEEVTATASVATPVVSDQSQTVTQEIVDSAKTAVVVAEGDVSKQQAVVDTANQAVTDATTEVENATKVLATANEDAATATAEAIKVAEETVNKTQGELDTAKAEQTKADEAVAPAQQAVTNQEKVVADASDKLDDAKKNEATAVIAVRDAETALENAKSEATDGPTFNLSNEYIDALKQREIYMGDPSKAEGRNDIDLNNPEHIANDTLLKKLGEQLSSTNNYTSEDKSEVNLWDMTDSQKEEVNSFSLSIINQIRKAYGKEEIVSTKGMLDFANEVAKNRSKTDTGSTGHQYLVNNEAADKYGLSSHPNRTSDQNQSDIVVVNNHYDEVRAESYDPNRPPKMTMGELKQEIYSGFKKLMFTPYANSADRNWELALSTAGGYYRADSKYVAASVSASISQATPYTNRWGETTYFSHFTIYLHTFQTDGESNDPYKMNKIVDPSRFDTTILKDNSQQKVDVAEAKLQEAKDSQTKATQAVTDAETKLNDAKSEITKLQETLGVAKTNAEEAQKNAESKQTTLENAKAELSRLQMAVENLKKAQAAVNKANQKKEVSDQALQEANNKLAKLEEAYKLAKENYEKILKLYEASQPTITSKGDQVPPTHSLPEAKIELKEVAFETVYENDPTIELGTELVVREGQNGSVQVITIGDQVTEIVLTEKVDKLVKRGILVK